MCTVTFLPKNELDFILTSNRDEDPQRSTNQMVYQEISGRPVYFPKDPKAGGTWFASDEKDFTLCILNGGFEKHDYDPPYGRSRGLMLLDFFEVNQVEKFIESYNFEGIEPFTLVIVDHSRKLLRLHQIVWNEEEIDHQELDREKPYIWSSSSLYPKDVREERKGWFVDWLKSRSEFNQSKIKEFHEFGGKGDAWNNFVMNRNGEVMTVSVTSIDKSGPAFNFEHKSLI